MLFIYVFIYRSILTLKNALLLALTEFDETKAIHIPVLSGILAAQTTQTQQSTI